MVESAKDYEESALLTRNIQEKKGHVRHIELLIEDLNLLHMMIEESRARFERNIRKAQSPSTEELTVPVNGEMLSNR